MRSLGRARRLYAALRSELGALPPDKQIGVPATVYITLALEGAAAGASPDGLRDVILALRIVRTLALVDSVVRAAQDGSGHEPEE